MKRLIEKFRKNIIPLFFWLISFAFYRRFYIFNIDFFLPEILFLRVAEIVLMGWLIFDPFSKACNNCPLVVMKNSLPIFIILTCVFLQHYFFAFLFFFTAILLISLLSYTWVYRKNKQHFLRTGKNIKIKLIFQRIFVVTSFVVLFVPAIWGIFLLNKPLVIVPKNEAPVAKSDTNIVDSFQQYEKSLKKLAPEIWENLNVDDQMDLAQIIVNIESDTLGVPPVHVVADGLYRSLLGQYSVMENTITINLSLISKNDATEFVRTICHEVRHSYQHYVVDSINWNDPNTTKLSLYNDVLSWKNDFNFTDITNDFDVYYNRSIEIDAREYSDDRLEYYSHYLKSIQ